MLFWTTRFSVCKGPHFIELFISHLNNYRDTIPLRSKHQKICFNYVGTVIVILWQLMIPYKAIRPASASTVESQWDVHRSCNHSAPSTGVTARPGNARHSAYSGTRLDQWLRRWSRIQSGYAYCLSLMRTARVGIVICHGTPSSKHETSIQCWLNVGPRLRRRPNIHPALGGRLITEYKRRQTVDRVIRMHHNNNNIHNTGDLVIFARFYSSGISRISRKHYYNSVTYHRNR